MEMKHLVATFGEQLKHAIELGEAAGINLASKNFQNVVIAGLGGSGIGGNLIQAVVKDEMRVPVTVCKGYAIPAFVNENTLFIASSFSGNTEETLMNTNAALQKNAVVVCITSGGQLLELAKSRSLPHIIIPGESKSPRANLGYSVVELLFMLHGAGLIGKQFVQHVQEAIALLEEQETQIQDYARELAGLFYEKLPILYSDDQFEPLMVRTQQQINENSKQLCHVNAFPEMNHNEIVGWMFPEKLLKQSAVVLVRSSFHHPRVKLRMDFCKPIFEEKAGSVTEVSAQGASFLAQAFYLVHLFDWVSVFLADLNGIDPAPVKVIDHLKNQLANA